MKLVFERSRTGRGTEYFPALDVPAWTPETPLRAEAPRLPELPETEVDRHYTELSKQTYGVNDGFYPLGSCTMKYNPKINEDMAALPGFTGLHPLQPTETVQGALQVLEDTEKYLCEITGMDAMTLPAAMKNAPRSSCRILRTGPTPQAPPWPDSTSSVSTLMPMDSWIWKRCARRSARIRPA